MLHKNIPHPKDQQVDQLGAEELYLLVVIIDVVKHTLHAVAGIIPLLVVEKGKEQIADGIDRNDIQPVGVFEIDDPVTDIIRRFYQVDKWMAGKYILIRRQSRDT